MYNNSRGWCSPPHKWRIPASTTWSNHTQFFFLVIYTKRLLIFFFWQTHWIVRLRVSYGTLKRQNGLYFFHLQFIEKIFDWDTEFYLHSILNDEYLRFSPIDVDYSGQFNKNIKIIQRENPKASLFRHILWIEWTVVGFFASCWQPLLHWKRNSVWQNFIQLRHTQRHLLRLFEQFKSRCSYKH